MRKEGERGWQSHPLSIYSKRGDQVEHNRKKVGMKVRAKLFTYPSQIIY